MCVCVYIYNYCITILVKQLSNVLDAKIGYI